MPTKMVYFFGEGKAEGTGQMKNLLGGKGANLAEMTNLGIPVPPGFTITTEACTAYYANNERWPEGLAEEIDVNMAKLEKAMGARFGDPDNPLLVSVRSGARVSMPGMMDTVLNLGLNDTTVHGLIRKSGNPRFAYDSYRRFIQMYSNVVLSVPHHEFEEIMDELKAKKGAAGYGSDADDLKTLVRSSGKGRGAEAVPSRREATALWLNQRSIWLVEQSSSDHLQEDPRDPGRLGHCCKCPDDGLRKHGRDIRDRSCVHQGSRLR